MTPGAGRVSGDRVFWRVALLLFATGWAANHFTALVPVLRTAGELPSVTVNSAFAIYAIGLLPGLLGGGALADRIGPRRIVLAGATIAAAGNLAMAIWHAEFGVLAGRLVVGGGIGLAVSAGTVWAVMLRGASGATLAGIILTAGFATGPFASGILAAVLPLDPGMTVPFVVTSALSVVAVVLVVSSRASTGGSPLQARAPGSGVAVPASAPIRIRSARRAFSVALPMALWVFSTATVAFIVLPSRMDLPAGSTALVAGLVSILGFGAGIGAQALARRFAWGPIAGVCGAGLAAAGFTVTAYVQHPPVWLFLVAIVVLGTAYGLCLREGLVDVDLLAPVATRGMVIGVFYVFTYLGFAVPLLLDFVEPSIGTTLPLLLLAAMAVLAAAARGIVMLKTDLLDRWRPGH